MMRTETKAGTPFLICDGDTGAGEQMFFAETLEDAYEYARDYCRDGEWGDGGFAVSAVLYTMQIDDPNGDATEHRIHDGDYYTFADEAPRYVTVGAA